MADSTRYESKNRQQLLYQNIRDRIAIFKIRFKCLYSNQGGINDTTGESIAGRVRDARKNCRDSLSRVREEREGIYNSIVKSQSSYLSKIKRIGDGIQKMFNKLKIQVFQFR